MTIALTIAVLFASYVIGSVPFGYLVVKLFSGKDIRNVESGRTGGTNAFRAAGLAAGLATAVLDFLKGAAAVWLAHGLLPEHTWVAYAAPAMAILGHNYSIFLLELDQKNGLRFRGGAGGATCVGGSFGLWPPSLLIIVPLAALVWYGIGYASVTTLFIGLVAIAIFAYRAWLGLSSWGYVIYGLVALIVMGWSLRPNIRRLVAGTERLHGWRALKAAEDKATTDKRR